jgi:fucose 4-O-acetylase-like acetyltransferase
MENNGTKRNVVLDVVKGMAIILVVFGHAEETAYGADPTMIDSWYYPAVHMVWAATHHFHMAVFIFISGYLAYSKLDTKFMQRRFLQLIPGFLTWTIVFYFTFSILDFPPIQSNPFKTLWFYTWTLDNSGFWFLLALFALYSLTYLVKRNLWGILGIIIAAYFLSQVPWPQSLSSLSQTHWFQRVAWFMPFFAGGYFISKYQVKLRSLGFIKWFCLVAFPVVGWLGQRLNYTLPLYSWPDYTVYLKMDFVSGFFIFFMALLGIGMIFAVAELLAKIGAFRRPLQYLGSITLGIYCAHSLFRTIGVGNGVVKILSVTVVATLLSAALVWLLQRFKITDYLFLGGAQNLVSRGTPKPVEPTVSKTA